jgi:hypothetical protein
MLIEGFTNQEFAGLLVGLALTVLGYLSYKAEARSAKEAAENVAAALIPADASLELTASAVEEFYDLLKDLSIPKIFAISGIALILWSVGLIDVSLSTGS